MKLPPALEKALNAQINLEFQSAYSYLGMAAYFEHTAFSGFAQWMKLQGQEELSHAHKFFAYVVDRGRKGETAGAAGAEVRLRDGAGGFQDEPGA